MCGIVGFVGKKDKKKILKMLHSIEHRGRDGEAVYTDLNITMAMNRLAINDLSGDPYPMKYKKLALVFNGEIYNYPILKKQLEDKGIVFSTACDAEVILPLYDFFGPKSLSLLEGMFAIAIIDNDKKELILARDKFGEKPLYVRRLAGKVAFSSEVKALLVLDDWKKHADLSSLGNYFTYGFVPGKNTLLNGVEKVLPGHFLIFPLSRKRSTTLKYWQIYPHPLKQNQSENYFINELEDLLRASVSLRLLSDVPVGSFLSGGVDSSLVAYFVREKNPDLHTFSVSFPGYSHEDESRFASVAASLIKTHHVSIECTGAKVKPVVDEIGKFIDEPISDPAFLPTYLLAHEAKKKVSVVLTGEGADEVFGGYYRYHKHLFVEFLKQKSPLMLRILDNLRNSIAPRRLYHFSEKLDERYYTQYIWSRRDLSFLFKKDTQPQPLLSTPSAENTMLQMQRADLSGYLAEQLLMKVDKSTMAHTLESRAPYLDTKVVEFALSLPSSYKIRLIHGKYLLKKVAERYLPKRLVWRPKHGFSVPLSDWIRQDLRENVLESLSVAEKHNSFINASYYKHVIEEHMARRKQNSDKIWSMLVFTSWLYHHNIAL